QKNVDRLRSVFAHHSVEEKALADDQHRSRVYDEPPSGIVITSRRSSRTLGFKIANEPKVACLAGEGFIERVSLEPAQRGFRARVANDPERLPSLGSSLLLEVAVSLEGGGAATLHLPVTLRDVHSS